MGAAPLRSQRDRPLGWAHLQQCARVEPDPGGDRGQTGKSASGATSDGYARRARDWARGRGARPSCVDSAAWSHGRPLGVRGAGVAGPAAGRARPGSVRSQTAALPVRVRGCGQRDRVPAAIAGGRDPSAQPSHHLVGCPVGSHPDVLCAFPTPQALASADPGELRRIGSSSVQACTIVDTARAVADGSLDLDALAQLDDRTVVARPARLCVIGRWTAEYVKLRGLGRLHVFPGDDVGARNKLERLLGTRRRLDYEAVRALPARCQPYAGVMYFCLVLDSLSEIGVITPGPRRRSYPRRRSPDQARRPVAPVR